MHKRFVHTFFAWLLLCPLLLHSQNAVDSSETIVTVTDSVMQTQPADGDTVSSFSALEKRETISTREVPQARLDSFRREDDFWYANTAPKREKLEEAKPPQQTPAWLRTLVWIIVLGSFIAVVLWYLHSGNILIFRRAAKKIKDETEEEATEDIFGLNYERDISKAIAAADYRLAIRLWYLRTLKDLADKALIDYRYGRTNSDYVAQLRNTTHHRDFARLTRAFEYTWYGQFLLSADSFTAMQAEFQHFKKGLGR